MYEIIRTVSPDFLILPTGKVSTVSPFGDTYLEKIAVDKFKLPKVGVYADYAATYADVTSLFREDSRDHITVAFDFTRMRHEDWHNLKPLLINKKLRNVFNSEPTLGEWIPSGYLFLIDHFVASYPYGDNSLVEWQGQRAYFIVFHKFGLADLVAGNVNI